MIFSEKQGLKIINYNASGYRSPDDALLHYKKGKKPQTYCTRTVSCYKGECLKSKAFFFMHLIYSIHF
jgi:hypothetical protein